METYQWNPINKYLYTRDAEGKYHSYDDLPAIETYDSPTRTYIWMTHGQLDRDCTKGPAFIHYNNVTAGTDTDTDTDGDATYKYFKMGKLHNHVNNCECLSNELHKLFKFNTKEMLKKDIVINNVTLYFLYDISGDYLMDNKLVKNSNKMYIYKYNTQIYKKLQHEEFIFVDADNGNILKTLASDRSNKIIPLDRLEYIKIEDYLLQSGLAILKPSKLHCGCTCDKDAYIYISQEYLGLCKIYCISCDKITTIKIPIKTM